MYVAMVRVGEASERLITFSTCWQPNGSAPRPCAVNLPKPRVIRHLVLLAAGAVLTFFLLFVLPNFASVLRDFNAKLDPIVAFFLVFPICCASKAISYSEFWRSH